MLNRNLGTVITCRKLCKPTAKKKRLRTSAHNPAEVTPQQKRPSAAPSSATSYVCTQYEKKTMQVYQTQPSAPVRANTKVLVSTCVMGVACQALNAL